MPLLFLARECRAGFRPRWTTTALLELQERPQQVRQRRLAHQQQVRRRQVRRQQELLRLRQVRPRLVQVRRRPVHQQPELALA